MTDTIRRLLLFTFFIMPIHFYGQNEKLVDDGIRLTANSQKMASGVNVVKVNKEGDKCLMTYLADNYIAEERYGKSDSVYVALQMLNLRKPEPQNYSVVAQKGMKVGNHHITSLPYNPMLSYDGIRFHVIFEGALDNKDRGLMSRIVNYKRNRVVVTSEIDYLKVEYNEMIYDLNVKTYATILNDKGYITAVPTCFVVDVNPRKDQSGVWHMAIGCAPDNYVLVLKSDDLRTWTYERIIDLKGNETDVYVRRDNYFYLMRSGDAVYKGYIGKSYERLNNSVASRPRLYSKGDSVFAIFNRNDSIMSSRRNIVSFCRWSDTGHFYEILRLKRKESIHYYDIVDYGNSFCVIFSTDPTGQYQYSKSELQIIKMPLALLQDEK